MSLKNDIEEQRASAIPLSAFLYRVAQGVRALVRRKPSASPEVSQTKDAVTLALDRERERLARERGG